MNKTDKELFQDFIHTLKTHNELLISQDTTLNKVLSKLENLTVLIAIIGVILLIANFM